MDAYGAICRVAFYSSLALGAVNNVTVEFTSPFVTDPDGYLFCFTHPNITVTPETFSVRTVVEGGDQFSSGKAFAASSFLLSSLKQHRPLEFGVAADVLGTDPFYAESYFRSRYDDFIVDAFGNNLTGVIQDPKSWPPDPDLRAEGVDAASELARDWDPAGAAELAEFGRVYGNCALLTGEWKAGTRYEVQLSVQNPPPPGGPGPFGAMGVWSAPVTYQVFGRHRALYSVRGGKYGAVCPPRQGIPTALFDACAELSQRVGPIRPPPPPPAGPTAPSVLAALAAQTGSCVSGLRALGASVGGSQLPLSQQMNPQVLAVTTCPGGFALSPRYGECVACPSSSGGASCSCPAGTLPVPVGPAACGPAFSPAGASTPQALADELCARFAGAKADLAGGRLGDGLVANAYVSAFRSAAAPLVDWTTVYLANITYRATQMFDERRPNDPSRRRGIAPNCQQCLAIEAPPPSFAYGLYRAFDPPAMDPFHAVRGTFVDVNGRGESRVRDVHFDAVHALRFIGYVMRQAGFPCGPLYDPRNATAGIYGYYLSSRTAICGGFAKEKSKGYY